MWVKENHLFRHENLLVQALINNMKHNTKKSGTYQTNPDFHNSMRLFLHENSSVKQEILESGLSVHFIGCGGIGMCGLALLSLQFGCKVSGSDINDSRNTKLLLANGADINIGHSAINLPINNNFIVVYSSAVQKNNPELKKAQTRGIKCYKRGEYLAQIAKQYKRVISVAGSHGKTTVTAMIVHILKQCNYQNFGYLIGGWPVGWKTLGKTGSGDIFIIEADESDLSLTLLDSHIGVVLNLDDDHSWNVGGKEKLNEGFISFAQQSDLLMYTNDKELSDNFKHISSPNIIIDLEKISNIASSNNLFGKYQKQNATMAVAVALELGVPQTDAVKAIKTFPGVERRMQLRFSNNKTAIIEDYAHHPVEIKAAIAAVKESYPKQKLTVIFQPHRYARLKQYFNEFTSELKNADKIYIVPVFSAWSSIDEISSKELAENIGVKAVSIDGSWKNKAKIIVGTEGFQILLHNEKHIILVLGAGDINNLIPELIETFKK